MPEFCAKSTMINTKQNDAESIILSLPTFRAGTAVALGAEVGISKRTTDLIINALVERGDVLKIARGLYANRGFVAERGDLALAAIANTYQEEMAISLSSALHDLDRENHGLVQAVVPLGRVGCLNTIAGTIEVHQVSGRLLSSLEKHFGNGVCYTKPPIPGVRIHSPEMAIAVSAYLEACGKRANFEIRPTSTDKPINWQTVDEMLKVAKIPVRFIEPVAESISTAQASVIGNTKDQAKERAHDSAPDFGM